MPNAERKLIVLNRHRIRSIARSPVHPISRYSGGFTLIEILIALTVMVVGLLGLLALFPVAIRNTTISAEESQASILALSIHNALQDGASRARIVAGKYPFNWGQGTPMGGVPGWYPFFEIPFSHSGVPLQGDGKNNPSEWEEFEPVIGLLSNPNSGRNFNGIYYMILPVNPWSLTTVSSLVYYFPRRNKLFNSDLPAFSPMPPAMMATNNNGKPEDKIDKDATANHRVFYLGKWTGGQQSYKTPDRILDLETGGLSPESEQDPYAQYAYRLEARPVIRNGIPQKGVWEFTVFIYRNYQEFGATALIKDGTIAQYNWYDPSAKVDKNKLVLQYKFYTSLPSMQ